MLFGRREETLEVSADRLEAFQRELFEHDTERTVSQGANSLNRLQKGLDLFSHAIETLSSHTGTPDEEYIGRTSVGVASDQKRNYEMALRNALASLREELARNDDETRYERLQREKLSFESFISKLLSINSNFKLVVLGYSAQMGAFKKAFAAIEKGVKEFGIALEKGAEQLKQYDALNSRIARFQALREELRAISDTTANASDAEVSAREKESASASASQVETKRTELSRKMSVVASHADRLSSSLGDLLLPIERASRKFDHDAKKGPKLGDYVTDPYSKSWNVTERAEFQTLLKDLRKSVMDGKVDMKNSEGIAAHIDLIMESDIAGLVGEIKAIRAEQDSIKEEIRSCEDEIRMLLSRASSSDSVLAERAKMLENKSKLEAEANSAMLEISKLFYEIYKKQIKIID